MSFDRFDYLSNDEYMNITKFKNGVPLRAMKTFIREKMGHTT